MVKTGLDGFEDPNQRPTAWKELMSYGRNRHQSLCSYCGHPLMAHYAGRCHCGCSGSAVSTQRRPNPEPVVKVRQPQSPTTVGPQAELLIDWLRQNLDGRDATRMLALLAQAKGRTGFETAPNGMATLMQFVAKWVTEDEARLYRRALETRLKAGQPLIQR